MTDLLVVYSPVGGGHKAAALALAEAGRARGWSVETRDLFEFAPRVVGDAYLATHLTWTGRSPETYGNAYFSSNYRGGPLEPLRLKLDQLLFAPLRAEVRALRPRVVVATHHLPLVVLGRERRKGRLGAPVLCTVTDYTAHAVWAERGVDAFCVGADLARRELGLHGVPASRIVRTGIPVREAFERVAPVRAPRPREPLRVLVTSGGFGVGPLSRIVRSLAGVPDVALTVVCGASKELRARVEREVRAAGVAARVIGFESDMPARVAEAHVVVGKAGGLTVSESLTAGRAMIIVGAVPGNETINEAFVATGGAGHAASPEDVGAVLAAMRARGDVAVMGARARSLVMHDAAARVLACARAMTAGPSRRAA